MGVFSYPPSGHPSDSLCDDRSVGDALFYLLLGNPWRAQCRDTANSPTGDTALQLSDCWNTTPWLLSFLPSTSPCQNLIIKARPNALYTQQSVNVFPVFSTLQWLGTRWICWGLRELHWFTDKQLFNFIGYVVTGAAQEDLPATDKMCRALPATRVSWTDH